MDRAFPTRLPISPTAHRPARPLLAAVDESFAAINSATGRDAALILAGLLGSICIAWAGRNLVFGTAQGLSRSTADHRQFTRKHRERVASSFRLVPIPPAHEASFIVRQSSAE